MGCSSLRDEVEEPILASDHPACAYSSDQAVANRERGCECDEGLLEVSLTHDFEMMTSEITYGHFETIVGSLPPEESLFELLGGWGREGDEAMLLSRSQTWAFAAALSERLNFEVCSQDENPYMCEGYRLPTEAEWEYAARANEPYKYAGSNNLEEVLPPVDANSYQVCQAKKNGFGLCDMSGNLSERTFDYYHPTPFYDLEPGATIFEDPWQPKVQGNPSIENFPSGGRGGSDGLIDGLLGLERGARSRNAYRGQLGGDLGIDGASLFEMDGDLAEGARLVRTIF